MVKDAIIFQCWQCSRSAVGKIDWITQLVCIEEVEKMVGKAWETLLGNCSNDTKVLCLCLNWPNIHILFTNYQATFL
jgi:hypothetical protein